MAATLMIPIPRTSINVRVTSAEVAISSLPSINRSRVISSATREYPLSTRPSAHSLFPIPLSPRIKTPTPMMSTMLPCSLVEGAKSSSRQSVIRLTRRGVGMGEIKTGTLAA